MRVLLFMVLIAGITLGCTKNKFTKNLQGHYTGTFIRSGSNPLENPPTAQVSLKLTATDFSGSSNVPRYPVICNGTYAADGRDLVVTNECFFTADFDWTLIFNGRYKYEVDGNNLRIWRNYDNGQRDYYELSK